MNKVTHWLYESGVSFAAHAAGAFIFLFLTAYAKSVKDEARFAYYWEHPEELVSPAVFTVLVFLCFALLRNVIKQRRTLASFGVRLFSMHGTAEVKKSDWAALCKDVNRASKEHSPLWILGATGKETFSGASSPLFDALKTYDGEIKILLIRPDSFAFDHRCSSLGMSQDNYRDEIIDSIDVCKELKTRKGRSVEVKLYESLPIWKMVMTNRVLWVQFYKPGAHVDDTPMYCLSTAEPARRRFLTASAPFSRSGGRMTAASHWILSSS